MIRMEIKTRVLPADEAGVAEAAQLLRQGQLVALPTETVYGIAADARNGAAVRDIFVAKGRPQDNPLIVHVTGPEMLPGLVSEVPERAQLLMAAFCPGPLTIIMPRGPEVADECCAGLDTVGIRMPSHPVARAVIQQSGCAFAAPSANLSGKPSPTNAQDVFTDMDGRLPLILDGGECDVGVESTVVSVVGEKPTLFRPGHITLEDLERALGEEVEVSKAILEKLPEGAVVRSPGMKYKHYAPGEKVYFIQENKAVVAATIGQKPYEEGFRLVIAHIDCPRLDLRPNPLYESDHMSYFRTHYYGGIRKYQWATIPLAIHGVFTRADGSSVNFAIGEDENDPVFCITDLLPHLGAEQNERKLSEGIKGEELNVLIGSDTVEEEDVKEAVKLNTLILLNQKYGITERDFTRAEIEVVPAAKARDVGFDRSMIGAYGHDDRVDAYPALLAEIETKDPVHTTICVLTDKEEIGSDGVTGMQSMYVFHFMQLLCRAAGQDDILAFRNSVCLSADVTAAYDPSWASAFEKQNGTYAGRGIAIFKYTGSRGKSSASDANAELLGDITRMLDANNVAWQIGEMGRLDLGGGGTIAKYVANRGIKVLDMGVPVLSMHSPFEVIHKTDLYMAYRTFSVFCQSAD